MSIEILNIPQDELRQKISLIYKKETEKKETELKDNTISLIKNILSTREIREMISDIRNPLFYDKLSYESLAQIEETARLLSENLADVKIQVELEQFLSKGYNLDIDGLKKKYREKKLNKEFPDLDFKKIKELYINPPRYLSTYYDDALNITIDSFVFRKYFIAVIQMIFNHMDFVVVNIGDEGAGKSCKSSQDIYMIWWIMTEIKLIGYKFDIKEIFANTLEMFGELEDKYYGVPFRILALDEGNELNRQDWKEETVKMFWQRLRRERHERRIKLINIPVLGEMIINIVLSRVNFIFNMMNKNEVKTGTLFKGDYDFYIIPRGDRIFSPTLNRELKKEDIKNKLYVNLKDKEYLKGLPRDIIVKRCHCNGVWGFKEEDYLREMKDSNKKYTIYKGLKFGITELYAFYKANVNMRKLQVKQGDPIYPSLCKMVYRVKKFWNNDPVLLAKYDNIFKQKIELRDDD